ncbi:MAG: hypothetical protein ACR2PX_02775 [Endozoicomonas sp.]|uniref:hypothetical protein n=1 Tax=Endozoicomonas sp. TaxID=1892382 RepID=UPI003D9BF2D0
MDILFTNDGSDLFAPRLGLTTAGKALMGQFNSSSVTSVPPTPYIQDGHNPVRVSTSAPSISLNTPISVVPSSGSMLSGFNADSGHSMTTPVLTGESGGSLFGFDFDEDPGGFLAGLIGSDPVPALPLPGVTMDPEMERMAMELVNTSGISFEGWSGGINPLNLLTTATSSTGSDYPHGSGIAASTPPEASEAVVQASRPIAKAGKSKKPKSATFMGKNLEGVAEKLMADEAARKCPVNGQTIGERVTKDKLTNMPVDDFNAMLANNELKDTDVAVMKEWRRRNKNKFSAQVARKRKREEVQGLDAEVDDLKKQKIELEEKLKSLPGEIKEWKTKAQALEKEAFEKR